MPTEPAFSLKHPVAMRYFHEVAKAGSFRQAAEQTHIAVSAINRHVKHLEDQLGTLLFERGRGRSGLKLTAAGEILLHHVKRAMSELAAAQSELNALQGLRRGTVDFGVNEGIWRELLPHLLIGFKKAHPEIDYRVTAGSSTRLVELVMEDEIDFAVAFNPQLNENLNVLIRRNVDSGVMVPRDHPLAKRRSVRLSECAEYDLVMPDSSLALRATLDLMFARVGVKPRAVLTTNSYEIMRSATQAGVGIAILTQHLFHHARERHEAAFVPIREALIGPQVLVCIARKGRHLPVAATAMVAQIDAALKAPSRR
ncbi:LysR family transcriptional regulator [Variovorax sp. KK3]|uniref:LysR family transcriptional regulator n=1 Tax=Variovorax sp. KK3 TaxID=1855728 RepID=UPI00097BBB30|nr:LysR family transcriptional regulator [Variovorax sp. KK3]